MAWWTLGIGSLIDGIKTIAGSWMEKKKIEAQGKVDIEKAKVEGQIKKIQTTLEGDVQYDLSALEGMKHSWKDEWFSILLSLPFIMIFIPGLQEYIKLGFEYLQAYTPEWYQICFIGAIVASFGLKEWFKGKLIK